MIFPASTPVGDWLNLSLEEDGAVLCMNFAERHIGNPLIRSMHGGGLIDTAAEAAVELHLAASGQTFMIDLTSTRIDFLRVTKDASVRARATLVRVARRLAFVDVTCWQDTEDTPAARGTCQLRIFQED